MPAIDLRPATDQLARLVAAVPDQALDAPTPCDGTVGDLLDHIGGLAPAFTAAARKDPDPAGREPRADASSLPADWRARIPAALGAMGTAWQDPAAWTGTTTAGGIDLTGEECGLVALDEVVVHGWDLARATGLPWEVDDTSLEAVHRFVLAFAAPEAEPQREGLFGPVVPVPDDARLLDRVLGLTGRDPAWAPHR